LGSSRHPCLRSARGSLQPRRGEIFIVASVDKKPSPVEEAAKVKDCAVLFIVAEKEELFDWFDQYLKK
jgi:hypothetical protein